VAERVAGARRGWSFIGIRLREILLAIFWEGQVDAAHVESGAKQHLLDETAVVAATATTTAAASITSSGRIAAIAAVSIHLPRSERGGAGEYLDCPICPSKR
jgi:hypothetical protein